MRRQLTLLLWWFIVHETTVDWGGYVTEHYNVWGPFETIEDCRDQRDKFLNLDAIVVTHCEKWDALQRQHNIEHSGRVS